MSEDRPVVGFVGLGAMGLPLASRISMRFRVLAFDTDPERVALLDGAESASVADMARDADIVCLCLPSKTASKSVVGELASQPDPTVRIVVEMSTLGPRCVEENSSVLDDVGIALVDAPISGGVKAAAEGALAAMVAGPPNAVQQVEPILEQVATRLFRMGNRAGLGQVMKLTNNVIALSALPLTSEALVFGISHGLGLEEMIEVINASSGRTQRSEVVFPRSIIPGTFDHGATGEIAHKDVNLFVEAATEAGTPMLIAPVVDALYEEFVAQHPNTDYSYLHRYLEGHHD